jgi:hypothetical protein
LYDRAVEEYPTQCGNGHVYQPGKVKVGFRHCGCAGAQETGGHHSYRCLIEGCGDVILVGCENQERLADYRPG